MSIQDLEKVIHVFFFSHIDYSNSVLKKSIRWATAKEKSLLLVFRVWRIPNSLSFAKTKHPTLKPTAKTDHQINLWALHIKYTVDASESRWHSFEERDCTQTHPSHWAYMYCTKDATAQTPEREREGSTQRRQGANKRFSSRGLWELFH